MCGAYVSSLICCSLKALLSVHKFIAFSLNYYKRCFVKIHFWLFNKIGGLRAPFQSANHKLVSFLIFQGSIVLLTDVVKKTCPPLTAMWSWLRLTHADLLLLLFWSKRACVKFKQDSVWEYECFLLCDMGYWKYNMVLKSKNFWTNSNWKMKSTFYFL